VYKALDNFHHLYNNYFWKPPPPLVEEEPEQEEEADGSDSDMSTTTNLPPCGKRKRRETPCHQHRQKRLMTARNRGPKVYVALKRIYVTSSPERILNELQIMSDLRYVFCPLRLLRRRAPF
jgi:hypothetical protein